MPFSLLKGYFLQEREFAAKKILTDERLSSWRRSDKIWREMLKQLNPETNVKSFQSGEKKDPN